MTPPLLSVALPLGPWGVSAIGWAPPAERLAQRRRVRPRPLTFPPCVGGFGSGQRAGQMTQAGDSRGDLDTDAVSKDSGSLTCVLFNACHRKNLPGLAGVAVTPASNIRNFDNRCPGHHVINIVITIYLNLLHHLQLPFIECTLHAKQRDNLLIHTVSFTTLSPVAFMQ